MLQTVAVRGYRSLREVILPLGRLSIVTGANGAGKSRALLEFLDTVPVADADGSDRAVEIELYKEWGETRVAGQGLLTTPPGTGANARFRALSVECASWAAPTGVSPP